MMASFRTPSMLPRDKDRFIKSVRKGTNTSMCIDNNGAGKISAGDTLIPELSMIDLTSSLVHGSKLYKQSDCKNESLCLNIRINGICRKIITNIGYFIDKEMIKIIG